MKEQLNNCCGIDVHKKNIVACVMYTQGSVIKKKIKSFGTDTPSLCQFSQWLFGFGVTDVVMESTGVYWIPVFNVLEKNGFNTILANARNVKNVPGRKTDCRDSEWLCKLLRNGLVEKSFIPPKEIRNLRFLTRHRDTLIKERTRYKNRILKLLERNNTKLSNVLADCFGATGWNLIQKLAKGPLNIQKVVTSLPSNVKASPDAFAAALHGIFNEVDREILRGLVRQVKFLNKEISSTEANIVKHGKRMQELANCLTTLPGIDEIGAYSILGEIGVDMSAFPTDAHLASWACICPGNHESAGKKYSTSIRKGCNYLKSFLVQIAWAASRTKTYLGERYRRIAAKKGKKKALVALARKMLIICYHMIRTGEPYYELGVDFFDKMRGSDKKKYYLRQLKKMGYQVHVEPLDKMQPA